MNTHIRCLWAAALLLSAAISLSACNADKIEVNVHLTYDEARGALVEDSLGLEYQWASVSYEPAVVAEAYADWDDMILYQVKGWAPEDLLTEAFTGVGGLLYAADKPLPTLSEMQPDMIYVCTASSVTMCILQLEDAQVAADAIDYLENGEQVALPEDGTTTYYLKFHADEYEGLYYNVVYIACGEGEEGLYYLYDRGTKRCVEIPYELFYGHLYSDEETIIEDTNDYAVVSGGEEWEISFGNS